MVDKEEEPLFAPGLQVYWTFPSTKGRPVDAEEDVEDMYELDRLVRSILRSNAALARVVPPSPPSPVAPPRPSPAPLAMDSTKTRRAVEHLHDLHEYSCRICLREMTRSNVSVCLPCFHRFCYACITKWLKRQPSCALCKTPVESLLYSIRTSSDYKIRPILPG